MLQLERFRVLADRSCDVGRGGSGDRGGRLHGRLLGHEAAHRPRVAREPAWSACSCPTPRPRRATCTYDAPYLTQAFEAAGLSADQFKIDNAQGSADTMQTQAEADITAGASVLLIDALDSGSGAAIEANAASKGVAVIDYDRLTLGGPDDRYYVSFDNVNVGKLIGQGEVDCIAAWNVTGPEHPDHGRRPDRQQREAVRPGLQRRAEAAVRRRHLREGRRARRHVGSADRARRRSSSSSRPTRTSTRSSRRTTTTPTR